MFYRGTALIYLLLALILPLLLGLGLVSCDTDVRAKEPTIEEQTKTSFSHPEIIGVIEGIGEVKRVTVFTGYYNHYIYFVKGKDSTSINAQVSKNQSETTVLINGVEYVKK